MTNRATALQSLGLADEDWGPCYGPEFTHAEFAAAWRSSVPCPSEAELLAATAPPKTKEQRVAELLAARGLTPETEWQLPGIMAGMLALGKDAGLTESQLYAVNTGYRNAKDLVEAVAAIRAEP